MRKCAADWLIQGAITVIGIALISNAQLLGQLT